MNACERARTCIAVSAKTLGGRRRNVARKGRQRKVGKRKSVLPNMNPNGRKQQSTEHERLRRDGSSIQLMCTSTGRHEGSWTHIKTANLELDAGRDHKFNWMGAAIQLARKCHERASHGGADMPQPNSKVFELKGPKASKRSSDSRKQQSTSAGTHEGTLGDAWRRVGKIHEGTLVENRCHVRERVEAQQQKLSPVMSIL